MASHLPSSFHLAALWLGATTISYHTVHSMREHHKTLRSCAATTTPSHTALSALQQPVSRSSSSVSSSTPVHHRAMPTTRDEPLTTSTI